MRIAGGKQIPLSVQELVDCDTAMNKGCNGGNPLYAFEYTMTNALTSWEDYPYRETVSHTVLLLIIEISIFLYSKSVRHLYTYVLVFYSSTLLLDNSYTFIIPYSYNLLLSYLIFYYSYPYSRVTNK